MALTACPKCTALFSEGVRHECSLIEVPIDILGPATLLLDRPSVQVWQGDVFAIAAAVGKVDIVICDPPYTEHVQKNIRSVNTSNPSAPRVRKWEPNFAPLENFEHVPLLLQSCRRWCLAFCALESFGDYRVAAGGDWKKKGHYVRSGVWRKQQAAPQLSGDRPANSCEGIAIMHARPIEGRMHWNGHGKHAYWMTADEDPNGVTLPDHFVHGRDRSEKRHPAQKPAKLMAELVSLFSDPGETIFDPYAGSGATGQAALEQGRKVVLGDSDPQWAEHCAERFKDA